MGLKVLVTGASGFIGCRLCSTLASSEFEVVSTIRKRAVEGEVTVGNVRPETDWQGALASRPDIVIHLTARVHVMKDTSADPLTEFRKVNVAETANLAGQAAAAGVQRFVYLSSIKVNGEQTALGAPFSLSDRPAPEDAYAISKWEAEQALREVSAKTGLEVVVVRPPLVYGPGVKGNLARLLKLLRLGLPLPLGAVQNKRSLIGLDNLVDLLIRCVDHPAAAGQTFLVSDGEDLSTPDLVRYMADAMNRSPRLFPVPVSLLRLAGGALGKRAEIDRLVESLQIDSSHTRRVLGWTPPVSVQEGIRRMVQGA